MNGVIQNAARLGILPARLAQVKDPPKCPSCLYGAAHRRSWRTGKQYAHLKEAKAPGDVVSVDQLVSSVPGFIAQEKMNIQFKLMKQRFQVATVFVDHFSRLSYVHVHRSTGGDEAVEAKEAFEAYAAQCGVYVKHYHGDNGIIFKCDKWIQHCQKRKQTYTFCGADWHHQNGIAEHNIRTLVNPFLRK